MPDTHIPGTISSSILIPADAATVWDHITNVKIEAFSDPLIFRLLDIPKPMKAEVVSEGKGGLRIAYFNSGKRFMQEIMEWNPFQTYAFSFNPEKGFTVGYVFEISEGVFQLDGGTYVLTPEANGHIRLQLQTTFRIHRYCYGLFILPVHLILRIFQRYLLTSIKSNCA